MDATSEESLGIKTEEPQTTPMTQPNNESTPLSETEVQEQTANRQRPPVSTSWKPGQSGNPNGRPKKDWTWADLLQEAAEEMIEVKGKDGSITGRKALKQLVARKLLTAAAGGNVNAARELMNRMDGMPRQTIEQTGEVQLNVNSLLAKAYGTTEPDSTT